MFYNNAATCAAFQARRSWKLKAQMCEKWPFLESMGKATDKASMHPSPSSRALLEYQDSCLMTGKGAGFLSIYLKDRSSM